MSAYVYVLRSSLTGRHAIGSTSDLEKQIVRYTVPSRRVAASDAPWEFVYVEICDGMEQARERVQYLKTLQQGSDNEARIQVLYTSRVSSRHGDDS